jgi:hypothetical protein
MMLEKSTHLPKDELTQLAHYIAGQEDGPPGPVQKFSKYILYE